MDVLKQIYNEIASVYDRDLTGWVTFPNVSAAFRKCHVSLATHCYKYLYIAFNMFSSFCTSIHT